MDTGNRTCNLSRNDGGRPVRIVAKAPWNQRPGHADRSTTLTIFWHCGFTRFSFRTAKKARPEATNRQRFCSRMSFTSAISKSGNRFCVRSRSKLLI
jgi:hypothetical protein